MVINVGLKDTAAWLNAFELLSFEVLLTRISWVHPDDSMYGENVLLKFLDAVSCGRWKGGEKIGGRGEQPTTVIV